MLKEIRDAGNLDYKIDITVAEWKDILNDSSIRNKDSIFDYLEKAYRAENYTFTCKELSDQYGRAPNFYSVANKVLGERTLKYINRYVIIGNNGKKTYWCVATTHGEPYKIKKYFSMRLRDELTEAIKELGLFQVVNQTGIREKINGKDLKEYQKFTYTHEKKQREDVKFSTILVYPRDETAAENALLHAGFKCEYDSAHESFQRKTDGFRYMETHHLIPLKYASDFKYSIDIPENIVSLCSTCHDRIHYGADRMVLIEQLWKMRESDLKKAGVAVTLKKLFEYYDLQQEDE